MANFSKITSTVCGASTELNNLLTGADKFADNLITQLENAVDPSALIDSIGDDLKDAEKALKGMLPELPTIKSLGLQDELKALKQLTGNAIAFAEKLIALQLAFGSLDFEKLMELACDADNKKVVGGKVVTFPKNVTMEGTVVSETLPETKEQIISTGADLVAAAREKTYTESVAKIQEASAAAAAAKETATQAATLRSAGYTLVKPEE